MFSDGRLMHLFLVCQKSYQVLKHHLINSHTSEKNGMMIISGTLKIPISRRLEEDCSVEFRFTEENIQNSIKPPNVYLMSHREEWINCKDSHIESDWRLCLFPKKLSFINFSQQDASLRLLRVLSAFLCREYNYQEQYKKDPKTAKWPGKDFSHGNDGLVEAKQVRKGLSNTVELCYCGSKEPMNRCKKCY